jgi:PIN domain nuclease of toxin-antitoxin system
LTIELT